MSYSEMDIKNLEELAKTGDDQAQFQLAYCYLVGKNGASKDLDNAFKWLEKSANQNNGNAMFNLGVMYRKGDVVDKDIDIAIEWFIKAAQQNHYAAASTLGRLYFSGDDNIPINYDEAIKWLKLADTEMDPDVEQILDDARTFRVFKENERRMAEGDQLLWSLKDHKFDDLRKEDEPTSVGKCYIATAVYGSYDCPEVVILRSFRDRILSSTWYGNLFIEVYYFIGYIIVKSCGNTKIFHKINKVWLDSLVENLKKKGF